MSENDPKMKFWSDVAQKVIAGLVLGLALGFANHQFWQKQEEYKKLSERIDQRITIYTELSQALYKFVDSHNSASSIYRQQSCDSQCLNEKAVLDKAKESVASRASELLYKAEVYFPNSEEICSDIKKAIFKSYQEPSVQVTAKHEMYLVFNKSLKYFGSVVKNDIGVLPNK